MANSASITAALHLPLSACLLAAAASGAELRPPAVPLVACDPYFSIWSPANALTDADTVHWTGKPHRLTALLRLDGSAYRLMGSEPADLPPLPQTAVEVLPTQTLYRFAGSGVALTLTFLTPALPEDLDVLSRPVTYLTCAVRATDGQEHALQVYLDASGELAVNTPEQRVQAALEMPGDLLALKVGSVDQPVLRRPGDDIRIDWGYLYLAAAKGSLATWAAGERGALQRGFATAGTKGVPATVVAAAMPGGALAAALAFDLGTVAAGPTSCQALLAYDDLYSIQYMKTNLRPYWRRQGWEAADLLLASAREYTALQSRCAAFDAELMGDLTRAGGEGYARLAALAYRQCFAAGKFVADAKGQPISFCKENHSNGCIATSDVFYPMSPQFLLFGPSLAKSFLVPFMEYAASERWRFPFAPHDLGQYPHANGQRYGGGERTEENQMPVEESGNLLILMAAVAKMEGKADFAGRYWPQLERWAEYLKAKGFDPENQLCTDDFAGHLAHNVNLSAKAICGLGAFAQLCALRGDTARATEYGALAKGFAARWVKEAGADDHYRLAFDLPGTWSQKYNLVWDRILGLQLFPAEVLRREMDFYRKTQNPYGLPLDNRQEYTKLDWILWTATLTQNRDDFEALTAPVLRFLNETPDRSPMTDWYQTRTARKVGFTARPVVGGVFLQMLYDPAVWAKYAGRDRTHAADWAPLPQAPQYRELVPTAEAAPVLWRYTTTPPAAGWQAPDFAAAGWSEGPAGFGTAGTPGAVVRTPWTSADIWIRRTVELPETLPERLAVRLHHDEDIELYVNGVLVLHLTEYTSEYEVAELDAAARRAFRPGRNVVAAHCHQTVGGQYIDLGLGAVVAPPPASRP
jgi:hypothetical protein